MIASIGTVLRLVLHQGSPARPADGAAPLQPAIPEVELCAYAEDCRLRGRIGLEAERLTDMLNAHDELILVDVVVESLADGSSCGAPEFAVSRDELFVVEATGPRGNPTRRTRAHRHPLAVRLGPYEVRGYVHLPPGADILPTIRRRRPMVPLTAASISYRVGDAVESRRCDALIFNRECADWMRVVDDSAIEFPDRALPELDEAEADRSTPDRPTAIVAGIPLLATRRTAQVRRP